MTTLHFIGDSLIEYFDWQRRFPTCTVVNSGLAGETVAELHRRSNRLSNFTPEPDWIIIMIGTNNVVMQDFSFMPDYEEILDHFQSAVPSAQIIIHGLFPVELPWLGHKVIDSVNEMIESLALKKDVGYLNGCHMFNNKNGTFLEDGVHISANGYSLWANTIENHILTIHPNCLK